MWIDFFKQKKKKKGTKSMVWPSYYERTLFVGQEAALGDSCW